MLWHPKAELEREGPPGRLEMFWAVALTPLLLFQIGVWSLRVLSGLRGEPLPVSTSLGFDVLGTASWPLAAGVALHLALIAFAFLLLWGCTLQFQRWVHWRGRGG